MFAAANWSSGKVSEDEKLHPYAYFQNKLITADSQPDLDAWLYDDYWNASNWIYWFNRNKDKYGFDVARSKWDKYARMNTFMSAFNDWKNTNSEWLKFTKENGLYNASNIISNTYNTATNLTGIAETQTQKVEDDSIKENISWFKVVIIFAGIWLLIKLLSVLSYYRPIRSNNKYNNYKKLKR